MKDLLDRARSRLTITRRLTDESLIDCEVIQALTVALRRFEWQPIKTARPDEVGLFLLDWAPGCGGIYPVAQSNRIHYGKRECWSSIFRATHWMPLSEPPAALAEAGKEEKK